MINPHTKLSLSSYGQEKWYITRLVYFSPQTGTQKWCMTGLFARVTLGYFICCCRRHKRSDSGSVSIQNASTEVCAESLDEGAQRLRCDWVDGFCEPESLGCVVHHVSPRSKPRQSL